MSFNLLIQIKDVEQIGDCVIKIHNSPLPALIEALRTLRKLGYPMRNTVTGLIRECLYLKLELDTGIKLSEGDIQRQELLENKATRQPPRKP
jgi:hypothetical protein